MTVEQFIDKCLTDPEIDPGSQIYVFDDARNDYVAVTGFAVDKRCRVLYMQTPD